jgi:hypothetical protein
VRRPLGTSLKPARYTQWRSVELRVATNHKVSKLTTLSTPVTTHTT